MELKQDRYETNGNGGSAATVPPLRRIVIESETAPIHVADRTIDQEAPEAFETAFVDQEADSAWVEQRMRTEKLSIAYGDKLAVKEVSLEVNSGEVLALIGPSGCGKTTLLRSLNRLVELTPAAKRTGRIMLDDQSVDEFDVTHLRSRVGMLFQQPNPFPMSIFDNVAYGLRERGSKRPRKKELEPIVVDALERPGPAAPVEQDIVHLVRERLRVLLDAFLHLDDVEVLVEGVADRALDAGMGGDAADDHRSRHADAAAAHRTGTRLCDRRPGDPVGKSLRRRTGARLHRPASRGRSPTASTRPSASPAAASAGFVLVRTRR